MYTTFIGQVPGEPERVGNRQDEQHQEKFITYTNGQINAAASSEDRIRALHRPILSPSQPRA